MYKNILKKSQEFSFLKNFLQEKSQNKKVYYSPNWGNWGDSLIRVGALQLLQDAHILHKEVTMPPYGINTLKDIIVYRKFLFIVFYNKFFSTFFPLKKTLLIVGGGGAWCHNFSFTKEIVRKYHMFFHEVIVLPSTYQVPIDFPITNISFFARDQSESLRIIPQAHFCHDLAFYLPIQSKVRGIGTGNFFRTDIEKSHLVVIPENNRDISLEGDELSEIGKFITAIDSSRNIETDRLHVAIIGALLGKSVTLYSGNYFKSRAVYESSLKQLGVKFKVGNAYK